LSPGPKTLFIICGEPSGETYAASVARAFRRRFPRVPMEGIGSSRLAAEGVRLLLDYGAISVVGILEVVRHLPAVVSALRAAKRPRCAHMIRVLPGADAQRVARRVQMRGDEESPTEA